MASVRVARRRLANRHDHERRQANEHDVSLVSRQEAAPGSTAAPSAQAGSSTSATPTATVTVTATATPNVSIPIGVSVILPVACGIAGLFLIGFLVWHFWYRKRRAQDEINRRSTWFVADKFKDDRAIDAAIASAGKSEMAYPPRKVSSTARTVAPPRTAASSPLRNEAKVTSETGTKQTSSTERKPAISPGDNSKSTERTPTAGASRLTTTPLSPTSPGVTPNEKTSFTAPISREVTSPSAVPPHMRFSFLKDVNKLPDFRGKEPDHIQPVKRSASLLSSRMSVRRKGRQATAKPDDPEQPVVPSLRLTDADSPLEDSEPLPHPTTGKLVTATDPYEATMPDELTVVPGETLRIVEVYEDDWCLAERVGRKKGRGVIPLMLVVEKGGLQPNMRFSMLQRE